MTSKYAPLLAIARQQADLLERGDIEQAISMMDTRADIIVAVGPPEPADHETLREVLRLDRQLSSAIRERMIHLRNEAFEGQQGRRALSGYGRTVPPPRQALDRLS
jgi:hypothetical protein